MLPIPFVRFIVFDFFSLYLFFCFFKSFDIARSLVAPLGIEISTKTPMLLKIVFRPKKKRNCRAACAHLQSEYCRRICCHKESKIIWVLKDEPTNEQRNDGRQKTKQQHIKQKVKCVRECLGLNEAWNIVWYSMLVNISTDLINNF